MLCPEDWVFQRDPGARGSRPSALKGAREVAGGEGKKGWGPDLEDALEMDLTKGIREK